jgi:hypothetical protein
MRYFKAALAEINAAGIDVIQKFLYLCRASLKENNEELKTTEELC